MRALTESPTEEIILNSRGHAIALKTRMRTYCTVRLSSLCHVRAALRERDPEGLARAGPRSRSRLPDLLHNFALL
jgi:hypothetical protein